jgi:hypothetical protein
MIALNVGFWLSFKKRSTSSSRNLTQPSTRMMGKRPSAAMVSTFRMLIANRVATSVLVRSCGRRFDGCASSISKTTVSPIERARYDLHVSVIMFYNPRYSLMTISSPRSCSV